MDYEKVYKKALEKAKRALYCDHKGYIETDKELILSLFPELNGEPIDIVDITLEGENGNYHADIKAVARKENKL